MNDYRDIWAFGAWLNGTLAALLALAGERPYCCLTAAAAFGVLWLAAPRKGGRP